MGTCVEGLAEAQKQGQLLGWVLQLGKLNLSAHVSAREQKNQVMAVNSKVR